MLAVVLVLPLFCTEQKASAFPFPFLIAKKKPEITKMFQVHSYTYNYTFYQ